MSKIIISLIVIGIISILIAGYFLIFNKEEIKVKPSGNVSNMKDIKISVNGQESKEVETKCDSDLIKCSKTGCEQVC